MSLTDGFKKVLVGAEHLATQLETNVHEAEQKFAETPEFQAIKSTIEQIDQFFGGSPQEPAHTEQPQPVEAPPAPEETVPAHVETEPGRFA